MILRAKKIIQTQNNLQQGKHRYQISGLSNGVYIIPMQYIKSKLKHILLRTLHQTKI